VNKPGIRLKEQNPGKNKMEGRDNHGRETNPFTVHRDDLGHPAVAFLKKTASVVVVKKENKTGYKPGDRGNKVPYHRNVPLNRGQKLEQAGYGAQNTQYQSNRFIPQGKTNFRFCGVRSLSPVVREEDKTRHRVKQNRQKIKLNHPTRLKNTQNLKPLSKFGYERLCQNFSFWNSSLDLAGKPGLDRFSQELV
jgi:hypothetical protein